jgi:hypothetical protein
MRLVLGAPLVWRCFAEDNVAPVRIGILPGDPLARLGVSPSELLKDGPSGQIRVPRTTRYWNNATSVVTHTVDDTRVTIPPCLDAIRPYGIKATVFIDTKSKLCTEDVWGRLRQAIAEGHEIGSHSRTHTCVLDSAPEAKCADLYRDGSELTGSRDDILAHTNQPYVWSFAYPCGTCVGLIREQLARAGYLVARIYPGEREGVAMHPGFSTFAEDPYQVSYTQAVQKMGGFSPEGSTDLVQLNARYDEVEKAGGIYHFVSHSQWLDFGPDGFYEKHMAHIGRRPGVWYVPFGPLYAYRTLVSAVRVRSLQPGPPIARFAVFHNLDAKIYNGSITLEFALPASLSRVEVFTRGRKLEQRNAGPQDRWDSEFWRAEGPSALVTVRPNTILEFRARAQTGNLGYKGRRA